MSEERERYQHESYGQIQFSRINGRGLNFYGSELKQDNYISLTISKSEVDKDLSKEWYYDKEEIIKVRMTTAQFSELITSLNYGSGACCTIERLNNKPVEELPNVESRKEFVHRKFKERMKMFANKIRANKDRAKEIVKKKTLSKQDIHDLSHELEWLTQEVESNIPYFAECFQETMDEVVYEAKAEVENALLHKISVLGLNELHKQNKLLTNKTNNNE
jgi:hypothetical protein